MHDENTDDTRPGFGATAGAPGHADAAAPLRRPRRPWATPALIGANVAVFLAMVLSGVAFLGPTTQEILDWGADFGPKIAEGEWWRLLTAAFIHIGAIHLFVNMLALRSLGVVERLFGSGGFLFIYFASALGASVTSVMWRPANISAGASGALFGLLGALLAFFLMHRRFMAPEVFKPMMRGILFTIGINVLFGLSVQFVDNAAHFGGFATGFLAGLCLNREVVPAGPGAATVLVALPSRKPLVRAILLGAVVLAAACLLPLRIKGDPKAIATVWFNQAREALAAGDYEKAKADCDRVIAADPDQARAYALRGICSLTLGDTQAGLGDLDRALELDDDLPEAHIARARARQMQGDLEGEIRDLDRALELLPSDDAMYRERGHALYAAGRFKDALRDFQTIARRDHEDTGEAQLYLWLVGARLGLRDKCTEDLKRYMASFEAGKMDEVSRKIALVLIGEAQPESLIALAKGVNRDRADAGRALFFAASLDLLDGDRAGATDLFKKCIEAGDPNSYEHWDAKAELARM
jgi:membrane associated rhomboid family serine protease/tetratricopeptide (TPR) repeat protein